MLQYTSRRYLENMSNFFFKHLGLLSLVLLWLGITNHCVFEALFSPHAAHAESTPDNDTNPTRSDSTPCHDSDTNDHPCGFPCTNAGPVELKITQQGAIQIFSPQSTLPNFPAILNALVHCSEFRPRRHAVANIEHERLTPASLRLLSVRAPNAPPTV